MKTKFESMKEIVVSWFDGLIENAKTEEEKREFEK